MRDRKISIQPFQLLDVLSIEISKAINEHFTAHIVGHIPEEVEEEYIERIKAEESIKLLVENEEGVKKVIFNGCVKKMGIHFEGNVQCIKIDLISHSYLMDIMPFTRTFQNERQLYSSILKAVQSTYPEGNILMSVGENIQTKKIIVQYKETDWQFAKRLASHFNSYLVAEVETGGYKFFFGKPQIAKKEIIKAIAYSVEKNIGEYIYKLEHGVEELYEQDTTSYVVKSREVYDLCTPILFKNKDFYIYQIQTVLEGGELYHYYTLRNIRGFKTPKQYNEKLIGASLEGSVIAVAKDRVKIHVEEDEVQEVATAKWFPYSTVYSSEDGAGWYCMPEINDLLRVYFPNEKEEDAFAISSVHLEETMAYKRIDPDIKRLLTKYGKEIVLEPGLIEIRNSDNLLIRISDTEGITIKSDTNVKIEATEDILMYSEGAIQMEAQKQIMFVRKDTSLELDENAHIKAERIFIE